METNQAKLYTSVKIVYIYAKDCVICLCEQQQTLERERLELPLVEYNKMQNRRVARREEEKMNNKKEKCLKIIFL